MAENELPPMAPGGQWLHDGSNREPHYVAHEAHIKRLVAEGWQPVADPRKPMAKAATPVDAEKEEMKQRIANLEKMLAQVLSQGDSATDGQGDEVSGDEQGADDSTEQSASNEPAKTRRPRR